MSALDKVTDALRAAGCHEKSGNWSCPAHDDREPSLHVTSDSRGVAMTCHANCDTKDVVRALGLEWDDLYEEPLREVERYPYSYHGQLYEKIRLVAPGRKTFRWEPALNGTRLPLYRIEEALALAGPLYVIESEKDVDTLAGMGVAATCMPGGAGNWYAEYSACLGGRDVIIVADRDEPGVKHAMKVLADLKGTASSVRIVQSRTAGEHDDIGDHLSAGFALSELVPFRAGNEIARKYVPVDWRDAFKSQPDEVDWLFPPLIEAGTVNVLFGLPGVGKSLLTLDIALQVIAEGKTVMVIDEENRPADLVERLRKFGKTPDDLDRLVVYSFACLPPLDTPLGGMHLLALAEANEPALVILDTASRMLEGDENAASTYLAFYRNSLVPLKGKGIASLRLDHQGKDPTRGQRGSSAKDGDCDCIWRLRFQDGGLLALEREKTRSSHGEEWVLIERRENPLGHHFVELDHFPVTDRIRHLAGKFDEWGIPGDAGRPTLRAAMKEKWGIGEDEDERKGGVSTTILALVAKYRKEQAALGHPQGRAKT